MCLFAGALSAQDALHDINVQVWKPFIESYNGLSADTFMSLHHPLMQRFDIESGEISDFATYQDYVRRVNKWQRDHNRSPVIDLRFSHRSVKGDVATEIGYYRVYDQNDTTGESVSVGKFSVILQRDSNKVWKILMDADHGGATDADFFGAEPMEGNRASRFPGGVYLVDALNVNSRMIVKETTVKASAAEAYQKWTTAAGLQSFMCDSAMVQLVPGGAYEIYFSMKAPEGERGSEGCKVLSFLPDKMFSFSWNAPPTFPDIRNGAHQTTVVLLFEGNNDGTTTVRLYHHGWRDDGDWPKVYTYFDAAWTKVMEWYSGSFGG
jgi:uncharacterized protein YndB with AHSA1/START domain